MASKTSRNRKLLLRVASAIVFIGAGCLLYSVRDIVLMIVDLREIKYRPTEAGEIFSAVRRGTLKPDGNGVVVLPASLATVSKVGKVYITRKGDLLIMLLPTWRGKGSDVRGYMHCSRALMPSDVHRSSYGEQHDAVDIRLPYPSSSRPSMVGEAIIERRLNDNVYYVFQMLD